MDAPHILLVDDEVRFVTNMAKVLERHGFTVHTAYDGRQALDVLGTEQQIGVVVLDVRMPGMDGLQTLQVIKENNAGIEVVMLTGQACLDDGIEAVRAGAFDYLQKPYDIEDLIAKIKSACNVGRIRRRPVLWPRQQAGEILLSGFVPLYPDDRLSDALAIFNRYRDGEGGHMLFIVDREQHVTGSITRRDLLDAVAERQPNETVAWEWVRRHPEMLPEMPLARLMNRRVEMVSPDTPLTETARRMLHLHYDSMPVVENGCIRGVIRLRDVLQYIQDDGVTSSMD